MIPAPDSMRCDARHPDNSLMRCFLVVHGPDQPHQHEAPVDSSSYHATVIHQWRTAPAPASDFPEGPYEETIPPASP